MTEPSAVFVPDWRHPEVEATGTTADLERPWSGEKISAPCWAPVVLAAGATRVVNANVALVTALVLDLEADPAEPDRHPDINVVADFLAGQRVRVYTTASHRPEAPRYRVVVPYDHPLPPSQHRVVYAAILSRLSGAGVPCDRSTSDPRRLYVRPKPGSGVMDVPGTPLDTAAVLAQTPKVVAGAPLTRSASTPTSGPVRFVRDVVGAAGVVQFQDWSGTVTPGASFKCFCPSLEPADRNSLSAWVRRAPGGVWTFCNARGHDHTAFGCAKPSDPLRCWTPDSVAGPRGVSAMDPNVSTMIAWHTKTLPSGGTVPTKPKSTLDNVAIILEHDPAYRGRFAYNEHADAVEVDHQPLTTHAQHLITADIQKRYEILLDRVDMKNCIEAAARIVTYNPVQEEIRREPWDGVRRLDTLFTHNGAAADNPLTRKLTRMWCLQAVARALNPGCQADSMLIIASDDQGLRKTTFFAEFAGAYYTSSRLDINNYKIPALLKNKWVIEVGEFASFQKNTNEELKNFISARADSFIKPHEILPTTYQRSCVFCATSNSRELLTDPTGARRYWIIPIENVIDYAYVREWRLQLYAEAREALAVGESYYLNERDTDDPLVKALHERQDQYCVTRPYEDKVESWIHGLDKSVLAVSYRSCVAAVLPDSDPDDTRIMNGVGRIFTQAGWHSVRKRIDGVLTVLRVRPCPRGKSKTDWEHECTQWYANEVKRKGSKIGANRPDETVDNPF